LAWLVLLGACGGAPAYIIEQAPSRAATAATAPISHAETNDTVVNASFRNVRFHVWNGVALDLVSLEGRMHSTRTDGVVAFDDKNSFVLAIDTGTVGFPLAELSRLMNTYVFAYRGAPLRDLSFTTDGQHLIQRGVLHKVVDIPFEMVGDINVTPAGEMRIHPISMKICTIPGQGLMKALGVTLADLLDLSKAKGMRVAGNDLFIDPTTLLPPPTIRGHLVAAKIDQDRLMQYFGAPSPNAVAVLRMQPDTAAPNYMLFRGGTLEFGKLFMVHADMQVIDESPADPFDFDIGRYHDQLVAGYHRTLPDDGLLVFMPDLSRMAGAHGAVAAGGGVR